MPIEIIAGVQLGLYGSGWALAAWYVKEERQVLSQWAAYALLQASSAALAAGPMSHGQMPPSLALVLGVLGFAAAVRGVDLFINRRATMDPWLLAGVLLAALPIALVNSFDASEQVRHLGTRIPYSLATVALLLGSAWRLWRPLRRDAGWLVSMAALLPNVVIGALGLLSILAHLMLPAQQLGAMQDSARLPNMVLSLVMSAVFNFGYLFLVLVRLIAQLRHHAHIDYLTGLPNRRESESRLAEAWEQHRRRGTPLSVALLDLDHFKAVNDEHGHARGDQVLVFTAKTLQQQTRAGEWVGRWGGEEFLLVLPGIGPEQAHQACERLRMALADQSAKQFGQQVTASAGLAHDDGATTSVAAMLQRADQSLYRAKAEGRNRVVS